MAAKDAIARYTLNFKVHMSLEGGVMPMDSLKRETCYILSSIKYDLQYPRVLSAKGLFM